MDVGSGPAVVDALARLVASVSASWPTWRLWRPSGLASIFSRRPPPPRPQSCKIWDLSLARHPDVLKVTARHPFRTSNIPNRQKRIPATRKNMRPLRLRIVRLSSSWAEGRVLRNRYYGLRHGWSLANERGVVPRRLPREPCYL